jgi:hypothetical protein
MSLHSADYVTIATTTVTIASIVANVLPSPQKENVNRFLGFVTKLINFLALNYKDLKPKV